MKLVNKKKKDISFLKNISELARNKMHMQEKNIYIYIHFPLPHGGMETSKCFYVQHRVLEVQYRDKEMFQKFCNSYFLQLDNESNIVYTFLAHK